MHKCECLNNCLHDYSVNLQPVNICKWVLFWSLLSNVDIYILYSLLKKAEETVLGRMKVILQTFIFTTRWGNLPKVLEAVYLNYRIQQLWLQRRLHMLSCCEHTFCQHRYLRAQGRVFRLNFQTQENRFLNNSQPQVLLIKKLRNTRGLIWKYICSLIKWKE